MLHSLHMENLSDKEIIGLALENDAAFEVLASRYLTYVYSAAFRYVHDDSDAQDVTQEVFVKLWKNLKKIDQEKSLKPWLLTVTRNACLDFLKKKSHISFSSLHANNDEDAVNLVDTVHDKQPLASELVGQKIEAEKMKNQVQKLSPRYAEVVNMYHHDGLNFREIAEKTKNSLNTIKSRYRRAIASLKKMVK